MTERVSRVTGGGRPSMRRRVNNSAIGAALVLSLLVLFVADLDGVNLMFAAVVLVGLVTAWKELNTIVRGSTIVSAGLGVVAIPLAGASLMDVAVGFTQLAEGGVAGLAVAHIVGANVGFLISPFSGLALLLSAMSGRSSFEVGLRWNREFGLVMVLAGTAVALVPFLFN